MKKYRLKRIVNFINQPKKLSNYSTVQTVRSSATRAGLGDKKKRMGGGKGLAFLKLMTANIIRTQKYEIT